MARNSWNLARVVDGGIVIRRIQLDPIAAASCCDDRYVAVVGPDESGGAIHGNRLSCRASLVARHLGGDPILGAESPIGCEAMVRNR